MQKMYEMAFKCWLATLKLVSGKDCTTFILCGALYISQTWVLNAFVLQSAAPPMKDQKGYMNAWTRSLTLADDGLAAGP